MTAADIDRRGRRATRLVLSLELTEVVLRRLLVKLLAIIGDVVVLDHSWAPFRSRTQSGRILKISTILGIGGNNTGSLPRFP